MKLGIISDIHEDVIRLGEALGLLDRMGCDEIACLGDIAGFSIPAFGHFENRNASACLDLVKKNCKYIVAGNHDLYPACKIPEFKAGFGYPDDWYDLSYAARKELAGEEVWLNEEVELDALLDREEKAFLAALPEYLILDAGGTRILLSHYLYPDLSGSSRRYYEAFGPIEEHLAFIENKQCRLGFSGHKHAEGVFLSMDEGMTLHGFGEYWLGDDTRWAVGPCVANGKKENGCMLFDTETFMLQVIPLKTPTRIMQVIDYYTEQHEK